jgi:hypothetical protein
MHLCIFFLLFLVEKKKNEIMTLKSSLSSLNKTNYEQPKFQPQLKLVSLRSLFPSVEFKLGTQYNLSGKTSKFNNILQVEKYLIKKQQQQTKVLVEGNLPTVIDDNGKAIFNYHHLFLVGGFGTLGEISWRLSQLLTLNYLF